MSTIIYHSLTALRLYIVYASMEIALELKTNTIYTIFVILNMEHPTRYIIIIYRLYQFIVRFFTNL